MNEEIISIDKHRQEKLTFQEFILDFLELITGLIVWKNNSLKVFEISTNKKRIKRFGYDEEEKIVQKDLKLITYIIFEDFF